MHDMYLLPTTPFFRTLFHETRPLIQWYIVGLTATERLNGYPNKQSNEYVLTATATQPQPHSHTANSHSILFIIINLLSKVIATKK